MTYSFSAKSRLKRWLKELPARLWHYGHKVLFGIAMLAVLLFLLAVIFPEFEPLKEFVSFAEGLLAKILVIVFGAAFLIAGGLRHGPIRPPRGGHLLRARRATDADIDAITAIADHWYGSGQLGGRDGRVSYFRGLRRGNARVIWVLERCEDPFDVGEVVAYSSVLPEKEDVAEAHYRGGKNQYDLEAKDLEPADSTIGGDNRKLYVQAACTSPDFQDSVIMSFTRHMLNLNVADVLAQYESKDVELFVERFASPEHDFFESRGFRSTGQSSRNGNEIHSLNMAAGGLDLRARRMVKTVKAYSNRAMDENSFFHWQT